MLRGVERLVDLVGARETALAGATLDEVRDSVQVGDATGLHETAGHFAVVAREGETVRLARTIGLPLRYFVAKMYHGPFLVTADRIDALYAWCREQRIGWQFDPLYTRMVPAHYLVEIDQVGCPDPQPRYYRFFAASAPPGPADPAVLGGRYVRAALESTSRWLATLPDREPVGLLFSGGIDSGAVLLLARQALRDLGRDPDLLRAFTLDLGDGADARQAESFVRELGLEHVWEPLRLPGARPDYEAAIACIEDYHPLDVECAAAGLLALGEIRRRYPSLRFLLDGDGGDENLKSYPLEDSDLTLSSLLRNPLLYQEGWGIDAIKHSLTYSGGLSRAYVRTYAPARRFGFSAFSPFTDRPVIAEALAIPFEELLAGSVERLASLKAEVVAAGVEALTGVRMPANPKRRFQDGAGGHPQGAGTDRYRAWRVNKAWCRQVFLRQWEERLREAWDPAEEHRSGNQLPAELPAAP